MMQTNQKCEVLAPAGSFDCLKAAVAAGADAVYVGADRYSARAYAHNFDQEQLIRALDYVHLYGRKLYLTVNILLKESELDDSLIEWLTPLYRRGLDAVIVQDLGLCRLLKKRLPDLPIHASTQMSITSSAGIRLLRENGIKRVIPARELSLDEIRSLVINGGVEIEAFVHGAMCYAYSGKCLFSSFMGDRSGNRGRCAQPCRLPYLAPGDRQRRYWLSMQDLSVIDHVPELIEAGICSFKIEGRMKSADYVYTVTSLYRKYVDLYEQKGADAYAVDDRDKDLLKSYSRDLTGSGYYHRRNGREMITLRSPSFKAGRNSDNEVLNCESAPVPVRASVKVKEGEPAVLTLKSGKEEITASSSQPAQKAVKAPLTAELVCKRLEKTDQYPFRIRWDKAAIEGSVFLPVSALNDLRRSALEKLNDALLRSYLRSEPVPDTCYGGKPDKIIGVQDEHRPEKKRSIHVLVSSLKQFKAVVPIPFVDEISIESSLLECPETLFEIMDLAHKKRKQLYVALPHVARFDGDPNYIPDVFSSPFTDALAQTDGLLIRNLDEARYLREKGYSGRMRADYLLYGFNSESIRFLKDCSFDGVCYPLELHRKDVYATERALAAEHLGAGFSREALVYGYAPRMLSAGCVKKNTSGCSHQSGILYLTDRMGEKFAVQNCCESCYNIVYNQVPISLHKRLRTLKEMPQIGWRFDFTSETPEQIAGILNMFEREHGESLSYPYTKGHWDKGVL